MAEPECHGEVGVPHREPERIQQADQADQHDGDQMEPAVADESEHSNEEPDDQALSESDEEDDVDNIDGAQDAGPPRVLGPFDTGRMTLTADEHQCALHIKAAIESSPDLKPLSDFWYAQLALIDGENISGAVDRARGIQHVREEYDIDDTCDGGECSVGEIMKLFPGFYLSLSFSTLSGKYTYACDCAKFYASVLAAHDPSMTNWLAASYYLDQALCSDLEAVRQGVILFIECSGIEWKKNSALEMSRRTWQEIGMVYPMRYHQLKHFHTGTFINLLLSMTRGFLPPEIRQGFEVGCVTGMGSLDRLYLVPNVEAANERFMAKVRDCLQRRYENEATFTL